MDRQDEVALTKRIRDLEMKVSELFSIAGRAEPDFGASDAVSGEVMTLAMNGREIDAIKLHVEQAGVGLAEAKSVIDALPKS